MTSNNLNDILKIIIDENIKLFMQKYTHFVHDRSLFYTNAEVLKHLHGYMKSFGLKSYKHFVEKKILSQGSLYFFSTNKESKKNNNNNQHFSRILFQ